MLSLPHLAACQIPAAVAPSAPASEYVNDYEPEFSDAKARDMVAGVLQDAVQEAVMQCGYGDELVRAWNGGKMNTRYGQTLAGGGARWWL